MYAATLPQEALPKKMGVEEGYVLKRPLVEFYYKSDALDDPMISPTTAKPLVLQPMNKLPKSAKWRSKSTPY